MVASLVVGSAGVLPIFIISNDSVESLRKSGGNLPVLLSFAVGGLLGDVFLHLLPEAWNHVKQEPGTQHYHYMVVGGWILLGILSFTLLEGLMTNEDEDDDEEESSEPSYSVDTYSCKNSELSNCKVGSCNCKVDNCDYKVDSCKINNNNNCVNYNIVQTNQVPDLNITQPNKTTKPKIKAAGYLNLLANSIDNFTHGLAIAGSFLVNFKVGVLTTVAILLHEMPHEVGDYAILVCSGFNKWEAARAQVLTASIGFIGSLSALMVSDCEKLNENTWWILPFTAGGFINVSLISVLPDLVKETDITTSLKQIAALLAGIIIMGLLSSYCE